MRKEAMMALWEWTILAIGGGVAVVVAAVILRTMSRPLTFAHHWQRKGDFAVFDARLGVGFKRPAKRGRLQLAVYFTMRKVPLESVEGETETAARSRPVRPVAADKSRLSPAET
jgi:hypothetical protein